LGVYDWLPTVTKKVVGVFCAFFRALSLIKLHSKTRVFSDCATSKL
jgi:hypothetical protein